MKKGKRKLVMDQIATLIGLIWAFIGLIAGILFPMIYMVPMLFSSWILFGSVGHNSWANSYLMIHYRDPAVYLPLFISESVIFAAGFTIFSVALAYMVKAKHNNKPLVTNGPYKYIRHPQNLGILLMIFPFSLYLPFYTDPGIRTGDILSWILMVSLVCISSLIEEKLLIRKQGESYLEYRGTTGFLLPRLWKKKTRVDFILWKKVLQVLVIYVIIVLLIFGLERLLLELELVFWTRTF